MAAFLKIENIGVCPAEGFTVLGVSLADTSTNEGVIGTFGSGSKHSIAVCLRHGLAPVVFAGTLKMEFSTRQQAIKDGLASKEFGRIMVKYGGTDQLTGESSTATKDLGFVLEMGEKDWSDVDMALREFVSNAIDRSIRELGDWSGVKIEVVEEVQVRAKKDHTRIFLPLTAEVLRFYNNIGKWFLHFSEPELLKQAILPKANRNLTDRKAAVIYRKGVRVREFESDDQESLFDYNLDDLTIDEARKASDWDVKHHCGRALANASKENLATLFDRLINSTEPVWEYEFDTYSLQPSYSENASDTVRKRKNWQEAFTSVAGTDAVLTGPGSVDQLQRKGFTPIRAKDDFVRAAQQYGVQTPSKVLSLDEQLGYNVTEATPGAQAAVDYAWGVIESCSMTLGKQKPPVKVFSGILEGGFSLQGYYRDETVFIRDDIVNTNEPSALAIKVAMEEIVHFCTNATDNSRDFQNYLLDLVVSLAGKEVSP